MHLLSQTHSIIWGFLLVCVIGESSAAFNPITWSLIQETTPYHLMGRVFTLTATASMAAASAGIVVFGVMGDTLGTMAGIAMIGFIFLGTGVMVWAVQRWVLLSDKRIRTEPGANSTRKPQTSMIWRSAQAVVPNQSINQKVLTPFLYSFVPMENHSSQVVAGKRRRRYHDII